MWKLGDSLFLEKEYEEKLYDGDIPDTDYLVEDDYKEKSCRDVFTEALDRYEKYEEEEIEVFAKILEEIAAKANSSKK